MAGKAKDKSVESPLYVYKRFNDLPVLVGDLTFFEDDTDGFLAQFSYSQSYLDHPDAFALDPINLPLAAPTKKYSTTSRYHVLGVLFDAAPDAWGRKVINASTGVSQTTEKAVLLKGRGLGVGGLFFSAAPMDAIPAYPPTPSIADIESLANPISKIDEGAEFNPAWKHLLVSSWDIGGARPKAVVQDDEGDFWIAKFPKKGESYDRQRVEWANLEMAADIGMNVPAHQLKETDFGAVLLVKRFDRDHSARLHYLSAASFVSPSPDIDKREMDGPRGKATFSYARLADIIQRISMHPSRDLQELYARMVFNVLVHNVDDHLKNTGFLRDLTAPDPYAYRLSPLFDVVTQEGSLKHMLHIGAFGRESTLENAISDIKRMRITKEASETIVNKATAIFANRADYYQRAGMTTRDVEAVERCFMWMRTPDQLAASGKKVLDVDEDEQAPAPR